MKIQCNSIGALGTNCYFISNEETKETVIIDPADLGSDIIKIIEEQKLVPVAILLTHGHFDHVMAVNELREKYKISAYASEQEKELIQDREMNASVLAGVSYTMIPDGYLKDGEILTFTGFSIKVIHTPGHTIGSICYYLEEENALFSGDTLFHETVGRTDLATGSMEMIMDSIKHKLFVLPEETKVYPGHGYESSIGHEKANNPYFNEEGW